MNPIRSVCVYCGSSTGRAEGYREAGRTLGRAIAENGMRVVYGGGARGVMGAVAEGAIVAGGRVSGIIPRFLISREATEPALERLDELIVTEDMHQRKHAMFEKSDAFVALPGGIGTLEEIVEIMTWAQLGRHRKPMVFGNFDGFWNPMVALMDHMRAEGFLHSEHLVRPLMVERAEAIVPAILSAAADTGEPTEGDVRVIGRM